MNTLKKILIFLIIIIFNFGSAISQCPWNKINCTTPCGRFIDKDNNTICDLSELAPKIKKDTIKKNILKIDTSADKTKIKTDSKIIKKINSDNNSKNNISDTISTTYNNKKEDTLTKTTSENIIETNKTTASPKPYRLIFISFLTLGLYFLTYVLVKLKIIIKRNHRKFWNVLLLITFLVSCILGFVLVIQINYNILLTWYRPLLLWHVEFGISMTIIAFFHIIWHLRYFKKLLNSKKENC